MPSFVQEDQKKKKKPNLFLDPSNRNRNPIISKSSTSSKVFKVK